MQFYQSKLLNNFLNLTHAFTTRECGNLAFHVNDKEEHVMSNHINLAKEMAYPKESLIHMKQIHSNFIHVVKDNDNFDTAPTCDALITNKTNTPLMVMVADCSPVLFYDDNKQVIAVAHAGRQGAFKNIIKNVIDSFTNEFNSDVKDIHVSVGASIGSCCYEVGGEVYDETKKLGLEDSISKKEGSFYLDIGSILKKQLLTCGVKKENIEFSDECTKCKNDKYFSYRAEPSTGRFAGVIKLN